VDGPALMDLVFLGFVAGLVFLALIWMIWPGGEDL
jgi:hypothetical protein